MTLQEEILHLKNEALGYITDSQTLDELQEAKIRYLGRKGSLTTILKKIPALSPDEKALVGKIANEIKSILTTAISDQEQKIKSKRTLEEEERVIDITANGIKPEVGHINPVTYVVWKLSETFEKLGYTILEGNEIESDWYNFTALNIPPSHPARDLQDTFWIDIKNGILPRTHTSAMQVRTMEKRKPPFKVAVPGWVYRSEKEDVTHASQFYHFEGFVVGENISFSDLKGTLTLLTREILGEKTQLKFRASYFPFVEPCAEMSASCPHCNFKGCVSCGGSGWLEILGSGMIHPNVLKNAGIDPKKYSGFAFGQGPTRLAMIKYKINDIRLFTSGDLRFLKQF